MDNPAIEVIIFRNYYKSEDAPDIGRSLNVSAFDSHLTAALTDFDEYATRFPCSRADDAICRATKQIRRDVETTKNYTNKSTLKWKISQDNNNSPVIIITNLQDKNSSSKQNNINIRDDDSKTMRLSADNNNGVDSLHQFRIVYDGRNISGIRSKL